MTSGLVLAADIGGTLMRAALVDEKGQLGGPACRADTRHADAPAAFVDLVKAVCGEAPGEVARAVVGLPGAVDYETGRLLWAPNLPERWPDLLSRDELAAGLNLPVSIANDADLAAVGEAWFGAGAGSPRHGVPDRLDRHRCRHRRSAVGCSAACARWASWATRSSTGRPGRARRRARSRSWGRAAGWPGWPANADWATSTPAAWKPRQRPGTRPRRPSGRGRSSPGRSPSSTW